MACRHSTPQIIVQRCQIAAPRWPNAISSATDNAIFKNRAQNIQYSFGCVKANVANILLFNLYEQKFVQDGPRTIAIECNGLSLLIFEEKWPNYASGPKSALNNDSFWVYRLFNVCVRVFCAQMRQFCLFTYPPRSKWDDCFLFAKIGIFCKSIAGPLSEALFKHIYNYIHTAEE